jgi:hypothetical protein
MKPPVPVRSERQVSWLPDQPQPLAFPTDGPRRPSRSVAGRADNRPARERCVPGYSGGGRAGFSPASLEHLMVTALSQRPYARAGVASSVPAFRTSFPRGCQARRHDVEDNIMPGCQAPPPHAARISARFPGGATFNIVGPRRLADFDVGVSNNVENGTAAARGFALRGHSNASRPARTCPKIPNSEFRIPNS